MKITFHSGDHVAQETDALMVGSTTVDGAFALDPYTTPIDEALGSELSRLAGDARFTGKIGSSLVVPTLGKLPARRIVVIGLGSRDGLKAESIRRATGVGVVAAREAGARDIVCAMVPAGSSFDSEMAIRSATEAAVMASYRFDRYEGTVKKSDTPKKAIETFRFVGEGHDAATVEASIARGQAIADGVNLARDLSNEPGSVFNPATAVEHAERIARESNLEIRVLGPAEMDEQGMGAIRAVGKGSASEPRLIHLIYRPEKTTESTRQIGLVGKCITFDTGGYSIKPYEGMLEMKGDMAGGAAVLGAMTALRALDCPHVVHGVICAAENMISGEAFRPGDILTAMNGVTIEVLSTDAEGRLVLADGLVYTARQGATELIDLATLTGAIVVALGDGTAGLFCNDDALADGLQAAAKEAGERTWRMPLTEELEENIKGEIGDIKNTGGRAGGAITAALFIQHFAEGLPWAHLDIAGCNRTTKASAYTPKGATGWGVRTLLEYVGRA